MAKKYDVSLVLACYNESEILLDSVDQIIKVLNHTPWNYEIIFVDDASQDNTPQLIKQILKKYPKLSLSAYYHKANRGRGATVTHGIQKAKGKVVGFIDVDLEVSAWYLIQFIEQALNQYDLVNAHRIYDLTFSSSIRWLSSKAYAMLRNLILDLPINDTEAGYKFFKRPVALQLCKRCQDPHWFWDTEIIYWAHHQQASMVHLPVAFVRRTDKTSTVKLLPDTWKYFKALYKFKSSLNAD